MKTHVVALAVITLGIATSLSVRGVAQAPTPNQVVAELKQNLSESQKRLRQYEWVETTVISLKGEEKSRKQEQVYYGADGTLTKIPLDPQAAAAPSEGGRRGRLKEAIVEHKKDEMKDYMEQASKLIHLYVPPSPQQIQQSKDAGNMTLNPQPQQGNVRAEFKNFVLPSDLLAIDVNTKTALLSALNVSTYLDKPEDAVTLAVRFATLADGTSYTAQTTLDAKAKDITVVVENSGYRPLQK